MPQKANRYRAICFDLDGTLLGMDIDEFMGTYFARIAKWAGENGLDSHRFITALKSGTKAMALNDGKILNKEAFWDEFEKDYGKEELEGVDVLAIADAFYADDFNRIGDGFVADPLVARTVNVLKEKGYPLVLTTMPMFPLQAVRHRLGWAGIDPDIFERITTYENSRATKPRQGYYAENLAAMGVEGKDVLMVGNNTMEDLSFCDLGADAFLVTDWLLDPIGFDLGSIKNGTFSDFAKWVDDLPECANPALEISSGPIDAASTSSAYQANIKKDFDPKSADENSRRLANAIEKDVPLGKEKN